jgi:cytochrome c oxidase assembly protein subunit 15
VLLARRLSRLAARDSASPHPAANAIQKWLTSTTGALLACQIVLGGLVASNYAGLACPDWPTCIDGQYFPTWSGIQGLHLAHRMVGYGVALMIGLAAWVGRSHPGSRRWLGVAAGFAIAQVCVGIANVLFRVPVEITGLHSALAAGLICTLGVSVREVWRDGEILSTPD